MGDPVITTTIGGGLLIALFGVVVKLMLRADTVQREAVTDVREDRDDCLEQLAVERESRLADRERCDRQLDMLRDMLRKAALANQALEVRVAVLEADRKRSGGDGR